MVEVANLIFKENLCLILLIVDEANVVPEIKYEDPGNKKLYQHIYSPLNLSVVINTAGFPPNSAGCFDLPDLK